MIGVSTLPRRFWAFKGSGGERRPSITMNGRERSAPRLRAQRPRGPLWRPARCRLGRLSPGPCLCRPSAARARLEPPQAGPGHRLLLLGWLPLLLRAQAALSWAGARGLGNVFLSFHTST